MILFLGVCVHMCVLKAEEEANLGPTGLPLLPTPYPTSRTNFTKCHRAAMSALQKSIKLLDANKEFKSGFFFTTCCQVYWSPGFLQPNNNNNKGVMCKNYGMEDLPLLSPSPLLLPNQT